MIKPHINRWGGFWRVAADALTPDGFLFVDLPTAFHFAANLADPQGQGPVPEIVEQACKGSQVARDGMFYCTSPEEALFLMQLIEQPPIGGMQ